MPTPIVFMRTSFLSGTIVGLGQGSRDADRGLAWPGRAREPTLPGTGKW